MGEGRVRQSMGGEKEGLTVNGGGKEMGHRQGRGQARCLSSSHPVLLLLLIIPITTTHMSQIKGNSWHKGEGRW